MKYVVTARFDEGLFKLTKKGFWKKIGPMEEPCRCVACLLSGRTARLEAMKRRAT